MKLKIENHTRWRTDDLRKILRKAAQQAGVRHDKLVIIRSGRHPSAVSGRGQYPGYLIEGGCIKLTIPTPEKWQRVLDARERHKRPEAFRCGGRGLALVQQVAQVAAHEYMHNLGFRHQDMTYAQRYCEQDVEWAKGLELRPEEAKPVKVSETAAERGERLRRERGEHYRKLHKKAVTKLKRAQTHEKKLRDKVKYYERQEKLAAGRTSSDG